MSTDYDYIIVGGPFAAKSRKNSFKVLLTEAGGDPRLENETGRLMYEVPIFHGASMEYKPCA